MAEDRTPPAGAAAGQPPAGDPSMEDILASIRRILNEDEPGAPPAPSPATSSTEPEPLALTEAMLVQDPEEAQPPVEAATLAAEPPVAEPFVVEPPVAEPSVEAASPAVEAPGPSISEAPPELAPLPMPIDALLAPAVAAAATASVGSLLRAVTQDRSAAVTRGGPSIEDVVREELRPLLKEWLDQHLLSVVDSLVRSEIERVVGRAQH